MLKTALCISVLLVAVNVCYGHGEGLCAYGSKGRITEFTPNRPDDPNVIYNPKYNNPYFEGGHGHHKSYPDGTESWSYWSAGGYVYVLEQYANGSWDELDDFDDCKWVVVPTPTPAPTPYVPPTSDVPAETIPDEVIPIPVVSIPDVMVHYSMIFPKGISALHLPIKPNVFYLTDLFEALGDDVNWISALRPTVQAWSHVASSPSGHDEWISNYRGFVTYMENEAVIELTAVEKHYGYTMMYLKDGLNLVGVPRQAEALETIGDFYRAFPNIVSIKSIPKDVEFGVASRIDWEWFALLDDDVIISPTTGYMIEHNGNDEYPLWGTQWVEPVMAAPGITRNIVTTWGALKSK